MFYHLLKDLSPSTRRLLAWPLMFFAMPIIIIIISVILGTGLAVYDFLKEFLIDCFRFIRREIPEVYSELWHTALTGDINYV